MLKFPVISMSAMRTKQILGLTALIAMLFACCINISSASAADEGDKSSGVGVVEYEFVDQVGEKHSCRVTHDLSAEITEIDDDIYTLLVSVKCKSYSIDVSNGEWYFYEGPDLESTDYNSYYDEGEDYDNWFASMETTDPVYSNGEIDRISQLYSPMELVAEPEDYIEEFGAGIEDFFDNDDVDWTFAYNGDTKDGNAEMSDTKVEADGLEIVVEYTVEGAADGTFFYRQSDEKPYEITYTCVASVKYAETGLLDSYSYEETYDAGEDGKLVRKNSYGSGFTANMKKLPMPIDSALLALFSLGLVGAIVRFRR